MPKLPYNAWRNVQYYVDPATDRAYACKLTSSHRSAIYGQRVLVDAATWEAVDPSALVHMWSIRDAARAWRISYHCAERLAPRVSCSKIYCIGTYCVRLMPAGTRKPPRGDYRQRYAQAIYCGADGRYYIEGRPAPTYGSIVAARNARARLVRQGVLPAR